MALLLVCAIALGGCGTTLPASGELVSGLTGGFSQPQKAVVETADLDERGLEPQRPPPLRMYRRVDDPTQPFSPNYGSVAPAGPSDDDAAPTLPSAADEDSWQTELEVIS